MAFLKTSKRASSANLSALHLLRVVQERAFRRIGGSALVEVDVRIVCATHRDLEKLVGEGAMWPELTREQWADEVMLDLKAGSTGRPNKAMMIANAERLMPFALQTGEISPKWLAGQIVRMMDDTVDEDEAMLSGAMPIIALARLTQPVVGDPLAAPGAQGGAGAMNTPGAPQANAQGQGQMGIGAVSQAVGQSAMPPAA